MYTERTNLPYLLYTQNNSKNALKGKYTQRTYKCAAEICIHLYTVRAKKCKNQNSITYNIPLLLQATYIFVYSPLSSLYLLPYLLNFAMLVYRSSPLYFSLSAERCLSNRHGRLEIFPLYRTDRSVHSFGYLITTPTTTYRNTNISLYLNVTFYIPPLSLFLRANLFPICA